MTEIEFTRRQLLKWGVCGPLVVSAASGASGSAHAATPESQTIDHLRKGGCIVLIRHSMTVPGIGDPPGMRLEDCTTQRDLSAEGRAQARRVGQWFRRHQLVPTAVRSSQWCRCLNTAKEAFSRNNFGQEIPVQPWVALNSFFQGHGNRDQQLQEAAAAARVLAQKKIPGQFEVWVTHQVVVSTLTGTYLSMGEMIVAQGQESRGEGASSTPIKTLVRGFSL